MTLILSGTDGLSDVDGSAATPAIRGTDANTGIFFPAADTIAFSEGGAEIARFNADAQFVAAAGTASLPVITTTGDVNTGIFFPAADTIAFSEGGTEAMRIDSSGNVGIGTSSPTTQLSISKGSQGNNLNVRSRAYLGGTTSSDSLVLGYSVKADTGATDQMVGTETNSGGGAPAAILMNSGVMQFHTASSVTSGAAFSSERARITSSGNVGIGTNSPASRLHVHGNGPQLRLSGSNYVTDPTEFVLGQYDSLTGYVQVPGSGKFDVWNNSTGVIARFNNNGNVSVSGALSKGSGSFRISHPVPELSETHDLVHSFIEGPQADNIYRGKVTLVNGAASVNVDSASGMTEGTFVLLNREVQCFTTNETGWVHVRGSVTGNVLTIEAQDNTCTDTISWMVIGERKDKHMYDTDWTDENGKVIVEPIKIIELSPAEKAEQQ